VVSQSGTPWGVLLLAAAGCCCWLLLVQLAQ
jgi:hypothetical protein